MGKIMKLDQRLANMIAAGEVIERLGNVVKELVENAIDAEASSIDIELEEAGMKSIKVTDNGTGMDETDALMAFERHATSKIHSEYELFHLVSLGFRGEALASIAAVSKVVMTTSLGNSSGVKIVFQDGTFVSSSIAAPKKGTQIEVTRLFYHTPARLKHLKSPQAELAFTVDLINKIALSHPNIAFKLTHQGKILLRTVGNGQQLAIISEIYGSDVAKSMKRFFGKNRDYQLEGLIASPVYNRSSKNAITMIANHRIIRNYRLTQAVTEALEQKLPKGRYPILVIEINSDPLLIDANIHPTKQEVKFSEEMALYDLIKNEIKKAIDDTPIFQTIEHDYSPVTEMVSSQIKMSFQETVQPEIKIEEPKIISTEPAIVSSPEAINKPFPDFDYIGQYRGTYLVFQNDDGLFLIDQHAAAERIRYENYLKKMSEDYHLSKELMIPFNLHFSNSESLIIENYMNDLKSFGLEIEPSSQSSYFVRSVPSWFPEDKEMVYAEMVIRTLMNEKPLSISIIIDELAILLACKHSIKANRYINKAEIDTLLTDLSKCNNPHTCPHGRPIMVKINHLDIEKWFKRVM